MESQLKISQSTQELLRCPVCHAKLETEGQQYTCKNSDCNTRFPMVNGIPVFLNENNSVFTFDDFISYRKTYFSSTRENKLKKIINRFIPSISRNIKGGLNYQRLSDLLLKQSSSPRVLVLGGSILGQNMELLANNATINLVETDASFGPRTMLICDAHDIPFEDGSFDGVIVQAVLEHVADPHRCSDEIHRVLKAGGVVYAETPFMQQVHGGKYDFTRFTHLGHRRLFRKFDEIDSGAVCGPGMALAWSYQYFLLSFTTSSVLRAMIRIFASFTTFYLKYFDKLLINKPGTLDAASGLYFLGTKTEHIISDKEIINSYRGAV